MIFNLIQFLHAISFKLKCSFQLLLVIIQLIIFIDNKLIDDLNLYFSYFLFLQVEDSFLRNQPCALS